ncbi:hypothetical protein [Paraburkholderia fungorum]|uniref:hypothetical protein n=1 Tax=Paraburkholderia fungorum TaxID=134537 RepID=UPI001C1E9D5F|nr:hypothetical protein [Paraburkholderia fungorum]MBU7443526.1 hypothetical protein [Paraburkholderia fungorum]
MHPYHHVAQELSHIRAMIGQLEHLVPRHDIGQATPVTSPDYWRARIDAVRADGSALPAGLEQQVRGLLARLDALCAESENRAGHDPP